MGIAVGKAHLQPMPESRRLRLATMISVAFHLLLLLVIGLFSLRAEMLPRAMKPIEVSLEEVQAAPLPAPKPAPEVRVTAPPPPVKSVSSLLPGGGSPKGKAKRNPSPLTSPKPSPQPASNAGGKLKAAPAPPNLLTSKNGKTPAGAVGKGSAPSGPGGQTESPGEGPSYGPGVGGGTDPIYPKNALDQGLEGTVTLAVTVSSTGAVEAVRVATSSGHSLLDNAAMRAVKRWSFTPGLQQGKAAAGTVNVTFRFAAGAVKRG